MYRTGVAPAAAASPNVTIVHRTLAVAAATCAGIAAAGILSAGPASAAGQVCLTAASATTCRQAGAPGDWFVRMTVERATNASSYAVTLYRADGQGGQCLKPGQSADFPVGYPINRVRIGPGSGCTSG